MPTSISVENSPPQQKKRFQALSSSSAERPMASGLERGSRSANRLNQADMSLDVPPEAAANTQAHSSRSKSLHMSKSSDASLRQHEQ